METVQRRRSKDDIRRLWTHKKEKGEITMEKFSDNIKKVILAGIGAVAVTAEKSKDLLDEMVEKGELTVEQGKVLNEELKHNIKKTVKEKVNAARPASAEELSELLDKMTPEQIAALKEQISKKEAASDGNASAQEETDNEG